MMACVVINKIHLLHFCVLVASLFLMLCMNATVISSASEMVHLYSNTTTVNGCIETERQSLLNIKRGFVDINGLLSSWGSPQEEDCCQWSGVGCDISTGHVTHLNLSYVDYYVDYDSPFSHVTHLNLSYLSCDFTYVTTNSVSNISRSLLKLKNLIYLDLSWNAFGERPIPKFVGSLSNLDYLDLSNANFGGAIPHELGNLSKLNHLDLSYNSFNSTPIPKLIASFTSLMYLDLSYNKFIGAIPHELGNLSMLNHLDLNYNSFNSTPIPKLIASFTSLTYLDLSYNQFIGAIPHELGNLSKLNHLDLRYNLGLDFGSNFGWLFHLSSLTHLDLSGINIGFVNNWLGLIQRLPSLSVLCLNHCNLNCTPSSFSSNSSSSISTLHLIGNQLDVSIFDRLSNLSGSLVDLDLSFNHLKGKIPESLAYMTSIKRLDLSANQLDGVVPTNSFRNLSSLQFLDLTGNYLSGKLEDILHVLPEDSLQVLSINGNKLTGSLPDITRFSSLTELDVGDNQLNGYLPQMFQHKSVLQLMDLSNNYLNGCLPSFTGFLHLKILYLYQNKFSGSLPDFTGLQSLTELYLEQNKFSGSLPDFTGCSSLQQLTLADNEITEWKTQSIGQLTNLKILDISKNSIHSTITESHLSNLSSLGAMSASFNSLTFNLSSGWLAPFQLTQLHLASCNLGPKFPNWIRNQTRIDFLDFSNSQISDTIPMWFWNLSSTMISLYLSSNKLRGELSGILFSSSAPENHPLIIFDCSHNLLSGVLPNSWVHFPDLVYLNIGYNNFSGMIPMSIGYLISLGTLILRNNSFYGGLPDSLRNCSSLGFADFGLNKLSGKIPEWIGEDLPRLYALILKSNKFHGSIPHHLCHLSKLHFLDLSINRISGTVPPCFGNFTAMIQNGTETATHYDHFYGKSYVDDALASWKGNEFEYRTNFEYLKMIDLSTNEFIGEIPIGITRLVDLIGLNLSGNNFYGEVPQEIGQMKMLECLDLSRNKFSGEIPQSMSGLNFLAYLDVSCNNFSGRIPSGTQLQSFNASVYEMNVGLCGPPLKKICSRDEPDVEVQPSSDGNEADEDEIEYERWLYISAALGFGTTFWGVCGILVLNRRWRNAYFLFLNKVMDQLYVIMAVRIARFRR